MSSSMSRNERRRNKQHRSKRVMKVCIDDPRVPDNARKVTRALLSTFAETHGHELDAVIGLFERVFLKIEINSDLLYNGEAASVSFHAPRKMHRN